MARPTTRLHLLLVLLLTLASTASAQETVIQDIAGPSDERLIDLHDILYHQSPTRRGQVKVRQAAPTETPATSYRDCIKNMPEHFLQFMDNWVEAAQTVLNGGESWLSDPTKSGLGSNGYCVVLREATGSVSFTFPKGSDVDVIKQAARQAVQPYVDAEVDLTSSFLPYAFMALKLDHPEVFWIGNAMMQGCESSYSISYSTNGFGTAHYTIKPLFYLKTNSFDIRILGTTGYNFRKPTEITGGVTLFHRSVETILEQCQAASRHDKLLSAYNWLTTHNCYSNLLQQNPSRTDIGGMAWSPLSALEGNVGSSINAPCCEGYARALKVLCDKMGIPCMLIAGKVYRRAGDSGVNHMWNYVQMDDGQWYGLDATWDDPTVTGVQSVVSGYEGQNWFLTGSTTETITGLTYIESHPEHWFGGYPNGGSHPWELGPTPVLATKAWTPAQDTDPYDIDGDGTADENDVHLLAEQILLENADGADFDGNGRISIGDLVCLISRILAGSNPAASARQRTATSAQ